MNLTLVAVSLNDQPLSQPITAVFDARGGTIGRADHNTMALPDPQRHISRLQAEIVAHGESFLIRNVGAANPITVQGRALADGDTAALAQDAQVRIGGYLLQVRVSEASPSTVTVHPHRPEAWAPSAPSAPSVPAATPAPAIAAPLTPGLASAAGQRAPTPDDPFADLIEPSAAAAAGQPFADLLGPSALHGASAAAPFADLMADLMADLVPVPAGIEPQSAAVARPAAAPARLPDDFDPFASPAQAPPATAAAAATDPFTDLLSASAEASIDQLFGLGAAGAADPLSSFLAGSAPAAPSTAGSAAAGLSTDPLVLFGNAPGGPAPAVVMAQADNLSALHAAYAPPRPVPAPHTAAPMATATPAPAALPATPPALSAAAPDSAALWAAFCAGAGIPALASAGTPEQQMQRLGHILRSAVEGLLQLMAVRASTKHELRAGVTVIQQRNNNPLKFSPDAGAALTQLLQPPLRGFLDGPAAMDDAMHDLVGHSIGTVAGLRAAVDGMLDRFAPQALEAKLTGHSVFDTLLPGTRKARLWDLYLAHHRSIHDEAQEDFHTLFGKAFLAAYEQQIERLERGAAQR